MTTLKSVNFRLELEAQDLQKLLQLAKDQGLTLQAFMQAAIAFYINHGDEWQAFSKHCDDASEHFRHTGLHVTNDEVGAWIAALEAGNDDAAPPACHA